MPSGDCKRCGTFRKRLHRHRIVPAHRGGTYVSENIELLCANCHEDEHPGPGIEHAKPSKRPPREVLVELYEGRSIRDVATALDTAPANVHLWLHYYGIEVRAPGVNLRRAGGRPKKRPSDAELAKLQESGLTQTEIAVSFGVSQAAVSRWMHRVASPA